MDTSNRSPYGLRVLVDQAVTAWTLLAQSQHARAQTWYVKVGRERYGNQEQPLHIS